MVLCTSNSKYIEWFSALAVLNIFNYLLHINDVTVSITVQPLVGPVSHPPGTSSGLMNGPDFKTLPFTIFLGSLRSTQVLPFLSLTSSTSLVLFDVFLKYGCMSVYLYKGLELLYVSSCTFFGSACCLCTLHVLGWHTFWRPLVYKYNRSLLIKRRKRRRKTFVSPWMFMYIPITHSIED